MDRKIASMALSLAILITLIASVGYEVTTNTAITALRTSKADYQAGETVEIAAVMGPVNGSGTGSASTGEAAVENGSRTTLASMAETAVENGSRPTGIGTGETHVWIVDPAGTETCLQLVPDGTEYVATYIPDSEAPGIYTVYALPGKAGASARFIVENSSPGEYSLSRALPGGLLGGPLELSAQPWPDSKWIPYVNLSWLPCRAAYNSTVPGYLDIVSGGNATLSPYGPNNSAFFYYDNTSATLYFRLLIRENPYDSFRGKYYQKSVWEALIDTNGDGSAEWISSIVSEPGNNPSYVQAGYINASVLTVTYQQNASPTLNYTRYTADGTMITGTGSQTMYLIDWQMPFSAFSSANATCPGNITDRTRMRIFFATDNNRNQVTPVTDFCFGSSVNFSETVNMTRSTLATGLFGFANDTRDTNPPSGNGTWRYGENVTAGGTGWPINNPSVKNITARVIDPAGVTVNTTVIDYDLLKGTFSNVTIWPIPDNGTSPSGLYQIQVLNPITLSSYNTYDYFNVSGYPPPVIQNVSVAPSPVQVGSSALITAGVTNSTSIALVTAKLNGTTYNMTYNLTTGRYQATCTAPLIEGAYLVNVTATDVRGSGGSNTTSLAVIASARASKATAWNSSLQQYSISLTTSNPSQLRNATAYDFIPPGFKAANFTRNGTAYLPDYNGAAMVTGPQTVGWRLGRGSNDTIAYTIQGTSASYSATGLYALGIDPEQEARG